MIEVVAGTRIHISLADISHASARAFGGVGFMIDRPSVHIHMERARAGEWHGFDKLDAAARAECLALAEQISGGIGICAKIALIDCPPQHVGFGSKTALKLSLITGLQALYEINETREFQQRLSGRGGASGIGIHGFYEGGVIWDAGHHQQGFDALLPSSAERPVAVPPLMLRLPFPADWRVGLCLPDGDPLSGREEREFFEAACPLEPISALRAMAALYHGVLPAFQLADLQALRSALQNLNSVGFKEREISFRGKPVSVLLDHLHEGGFAAGMSSVGPLIYVVFEVNDTSSEGRLKSLCEQAGARWLGVARGLNAGARIARERRQ